MAAISKPYAINQPSSTYQRRARRSRAIDTREANIAIAPIMSSLLIALVPIAFVMIYLYGYALIASETYRAGKLKEQIAGQQRIMNNHNGIIRTAVTDTSLQQWAIKLGYVRQSVAPIIIGSAPDNAKR